VGGEDPLNLRNIGGKKKMKKVILRNWVEKKEIELWEVSEKKGGAQLRTGQPKKKGKLSRYAGGGGSGRLKTVKRRSKVSVIHGSM